MTLPSSKIALLQFRISPNISENMAKAIQMIRSAAAKGADIICLPELFRSVYFCQTESIHIFDWAEAIPGPSTEQLCAVAKELGVVIVASLFERRAAGLYHNTAAVIDADGSLIGTYRKMHIPDDPGYYEKFYFTPGDLGYKVFTTAFGRIGVLVCWDQWYPEAARLTAMMGADVIVYPTAIGWHPAEKEEFGQRQYEAWQTVQRGHAIANGVYIAAINRTGFEKSPDSDAGIEVWGKSFLSDPQGRILCDATHSEEEILIGEIDTRELETIRRNWPFLRDRRIDSYAPITQRYLDVK